MKPQRGLGRSMVTFYSLFTPMKDDGCSRHRLRKHLDSMRVANRSNIALSLTHLWVVPDVSRTVGADWVSWNWPSFCTPQLFGYPHLFIRVIPRNSSKYEKSWKKVHLHQSHHHWQVKWQPQRSQSRNTSAPVTRYYNTCHDSRFVTRLTEQPWASGVDFLDVYYYLGLLPLF